MGPERSLLQSHLILSEIARILILQFFPLFFFFFGCCVSVSPYAVFPSLKLVR